MSTTGHRSLPHTADIRIQAWAPTRDGCLVEAVMGLVAGFAAVPESATTIREWSVPARTAGETDEDALLRVLDEVIYLLDTEDSLPKRAKTRSDEGGTAVVLLLVPMAEVEFTGAIPKAVTLHGLRFGPTERGWACDVVVDV